MYYFQNFVSLGDSVWLQWQDLGGHYNHKLYFILRSFFWLHIFYRFIEEIGPWNLWSTKFDHNLKICKEEEEKNLKFIQNNKTRLQILLTQPHTEKLFLCYRYPPQKISWFSLPPRREVLICSFGIFSFSLPPQTRSSHLLVWNI